MINNELDILIILLHNSSKSNRVKNNNPAHSKLIYSFVYTEYNESEFGGDGVRATESHP